MYDMYGSGSFAKNLLKELRRWMEVKGGGGGVSEIILAFKRR